MRRRLAVVTGAATAAVVVTGFAVGALVNRGPVIPRASVRRA